MQVQKGILLATAGGLAMTAGAQAADLPLKAAPMMAPSWTGFYFGGHLGGAWQNASGGYQGKNVQGSSLIGGVQAGYNWQRGNMVYGFEADISGLTSGPRLTGQSGKGDVMASDIRWLATFRGRLGLAVNDTMAYMTGGLAVGGVRNAVTDAAFSAVGVDAIKSESKTKVGWTVGVGVEHMWSRNWTIGAEALFVDLGKSNTVTATGKTASFHNSAIIGRLKMNYKF